MRSCQRTSSWTLSACGWSRITCALPAPCKVPTPAAGQLPPWPSCHRSQGMLSLVTDRPSVCPQNGRQRQGCQNLCGSSVTIPGRVRLSDPHGNWAPSVGAVAAASCARAPGSLRVLDVLVRSVSFPPEEPLVRGTFPVSQPSPGPAFQGPPAIVLLALYCGSQCLHLQEPPEMWWLWCGQCWWKATGLGRPHGMAASCGSGGWSLGLWGGSACVRCSQQYPSHCVLRRPYVYRRSVVPHPHRRVAVLSDPGPPLWPNITLSPSL